MSSSAQVFPRTEVEALALLYVQAQNMSGASHKEFYDKYREALSEFEELTKSRNPNRNLPQAMDWSHYTAGKNSGKTDALRHRKRKPKIYY